MSDYITSGANFVTSTTSTILSAFSGDVNDTEIDIACDKIKRLLKEEGKIDLPLIIQRLNIHYEIAIKAIRKLKEQGFIRFENEKF